MAVRRQQQRDHLSNCKKQRPFYISLLIIFFKYINYTLLGIYICMPAWPATAYITPKCCVMCSFHAYIYVHNYMYVKKQGTIILYVNRLSPSIPNQLRIENGSFYHYYSYYTLNYNYLSFEKSFACCEFLHYYSIRLFLTQLIPNF